MGGRGLAESPPASVCHIDTLVEFHIPGGEIVLAIIKGNRSWFRFL